MHNDHGPNRRSQRSADTGAEQVPLQQGMPPALEAANWMILPFVWYRSNEVYTESFGLILL